MSYFGSKYPVGGMLTGKTIIEKVQLGEIKIDPFNPDQVNPNSYNLRLHPQLKVYKNQVMIEGDLIYPNTFSKFCPLDSRKDNPTEEIIIPEEGICLYPNILYIGRTVETTATEKYIPMLDGRSSGGRLGLNVHICAGFGDIGFSGTWTLEISVIHPLIVYPDMEIAQVSFFTPVGGTDILYRGKYHEQIDATASRMYKDFS